MLEIKIRNKDVAYTGVFMAVRNNQFALNAYLLSIPTISSYFLLLVIIGREEEFSSRLSKNADFSGFTPLHYAALTDDYECIKLLLDNGNSFIFY